MNRTTKSLIAVAAAGGAVLGSYGIASAASGSSEADDSDGPLTGADLDQAVAAALEHVGEGEVTETEIGDDGAAFGVEVRLADGSQIEVNLDADFNVIGSSPDDD